MKRGLDDEALSSPPHKARHEGNSPDFYFVSEDSDASQEHADATLCSRCANIDILRISTRRPRTIDPVDNIYNIVEDGIVEDIEEMNLGPAKALVVVDDCSLCRFLRGILPPELESSDEDVYLLSCIAIHRFEPEVYTWEALETDDGPGEVMYLYLATKSATGPFPLADSASDAVAHQSGSMHALGMGMLARPVDPDAVNLSLVQQWVSHCMENHGEMCNHEPTLGFNEIRLVDVHDKCLVSYQQEYDYLCLSYVWGTVPRPEIDPLGKLPQLPATIEDSMSFVKSLGKRYLWVDSVCIDQEDATDKGEQIAIMHLIYANAWATIIALTGNSATSGLPRVGFPGRSSQLEFTHSGIQMLSVMKTLKQQIESSIWSSRAWTFQEALLSPRCLYFTPDQVYFSCNMTQFCESVDERGSAFHRMTYEKTLESLKRGHYTELGQGIFRDPSCIPFERKRPSRWRIYSDLVCEYSHRHLTFDSDAYSAIRAALTALGKSLFPKGFFWGLPKEQLAAALVCWGHETMPHRRKDFPSWSCLGWKGPLRPIHEGVLNRGYRQFEPPFRAFACLNGDLDLIYASYPNTADSTVKPRPPKWYRGRGSDPVVDLTFYGIKDLPKFDIDEPSSNNMLPKLLFLECLVFQPKATSVIAPYVPESERKYRPEFSRVVLIDGVPCIVTCDSQTTVEKMLPDLEEYLFPKSHSLLLACRSSICQYHFMLIEWVDAGVDWINTTEQLRAKRVGTVSIHFQNLNGLDYYNWYQLPPTLGVSWWSNAADRMHRVFPPGSLQSRLVILE